MIFLCQSEAIDQLQMLANSNRQSILIEGPSGCGKTYLARMYSKLVGVSDFQIISPKVDEIRNAIESCINISEPIVLCIENLDCGLVVASYSLLKFLEEPIPNVYIVVTCRNIRAIPDTIISRSTCVTVAPPINSDISEYSSHVNLSAYNKVKSKKVWNCVRTFKDAEEVMSMNDAKLSYFDSLDQFSNFKDSVSSIVWKMSHYDDNSETPIELVIRYLMDVVNTPFIQHCGIECLRDLSQGRMASHAVLAKFAFNAKYCE